MKKLIYTMTQFDPDRRYNNINEVENILREILQPSKPDRKKIGFYIVATILVISISLSFAQLGLKNQFLSLINSDKESTMSVQGGNDNGALESLPKANEVKELNDEDTNQNPLKSEQGTLEFLEEDTSILEKIIEEKIQEEFQVETHLDIHEEIQGEIQEEIQITTNNSSEIERKINNVSPLEEVVEDALAVEEVTLNPTIDINRAISYEYFSDTVIKPKVITNMNDIDVVWKKIDYIFRETSKANVSAFACVYGEDDENYYIKLNYNLNREKYLFIFFAEDYPGIQTKIENLLVVGNNQFIIQINKAQFNTYIDLHRDEMDQRIVIRLSGFDDDTILVPFDTMISSVDIEIVKEIEYNHSSLNIVYPKLVGSASVDWHSLKYSNSLKDNALPVSITYGYDENNVYIKTIFKANEQNGIVVFLGGDYPGLMTKIENCVLEGENTLIISMNREDFLEVLALKEVNEFVLYLGGENRAFFYIYFEEFQIK